SRRTNLSPSRPWRGGGSRWRGPSCLPCPFIELLHLLLQDLDDRPPGEAHLPRLHRQPPCAFPQRFFHLRDREPAAVVGDEGSLSLKELDHTLVLELAEGLDHGRWVHGESPCELADRWQGIPRLQSPGSNVVLDLFHELTVNGHSRAQRDLEVDH